jgi:twitching motility protein PilT
MLTQILDQEQIQRLTDDHELDFAYGPQGMPARFRCNYFYAQHTLRAVFRQIPTDIKTVDQLGLPETIRNLSQYPRGLVLVTGPTGSGKSTTLAAMIDEINRGQQVHILTIEDPVEFVHRSKKALINQREVGPDTHSFANALRAALREDPDVILVGEMRDPETISLGITAAETGHLVFATLHTQDASQTMDRLIDSFPPDQQAQIRTQLSLTLQGVVSQQLLPRSDREGRIVATEILVANDAVRNHIREGKTEQLYSVMQTGRNQGMQTMETALADLVQAGIISESKAKDVASRPDEMMRSLNMSRGITNG